MAKDWKERLGIVYSTNPDFDYKTDKLEEHETLPPERQVLKIVLDCKQRKGKTVTIIQGFIGKQEDLNELAKLLKVKCSVGGSAKEGEIILQGDFCNKTSEILKSRGYKIK